MSLADFAALNERRAAAGLATFMNPRNSAAGHDPPARPAARRRAPAVDVVLRRRCDRGARASSSHWESLEWLRSRGFRVNGDVKRLETEDEVVAQCLAWQERRGALDFEIDGVVVKVDDFELQRRLGVVGRDPRWAIAWKFPPTTAVTTLNAIEWNVGKFGDLHPWARLEPVHVGGVTVQEGDAAQRGGPAAQGRARGRRGDRPARRRRDPAGALARAARAGARTARDPPQPPAKCPVCGTPTVKPRARSSPSARTATAPSAAGSCWSTSFARGDGHRRPGREAGRRSPGRRPGARRWPTSTG